MHHQKRIPDVRRVLLGGGLIGRLRSRLLRRLRRGSRDVFPATIRGV